MKILWTHNFDPAIKGSGSFMWVMVDGLRKQGMQIDVLNLGNLRSPWRIFQAILRVRAQSKNYDLVHAQFGSACSLVTMFANKPKIVSLRGSDWYKFSGKNIFTKAHSYLGRLFTQISLRRFASIIVMSRHMQHELQSYLKQDSPSRVTVITDPIDLQKFVPIPRDVSRQKYFPEYQTETLIILATLDENNPIKRVALAKEAIRLVQQDVPNVRLVVASGISHADMPAFISACDLMLVTSRHEGWPNCVKEALACGIPFVSTDVSDLKDIARDQSKCRIAEPDAEDIAKQILGTLCDSEPLDALSLRKHVLHMSMTKSYNSLLNIYKKLLD
jgi:glycosyltransferase involved in cell wall biosynthesis